MRCQSVYLTNSNSNKPEKCNVLPIPAIVEYRFSMLIELFVVHIPPLFEPEIYRCYMEKKTIALLMMVCADLWNISVYTFDIYYIHIDVCVQNLVMVYTLQDTQPMQ